MPSRRATLVLLATIFALLPATRVAQAQSTDQGLANWLFSDDPLLPGLKNQEIAEGWQYSAGAQLRYRYMDERNRLRPLGQTTRDTYHLYRFTPFVEVKNEDITLYVQAIDAESFGEELPILPIDTNRVDLLQYYADLNLFEFDDGGQIHLKVGRQFLIYGSQHLVSNLGWSNTFRNFEGVKGTYSNDIWSIDAFWTKPVNGAASARQFRPYSRDEWDSSQTFGGIYATLKEVPGGTLDLYWLWLYEEDDLPTRLDGNRHTIGSRYAGKAPLMEGTEAEGLFTLNWDLEGAWQFGKDDLGPGPSKTINSAMLSAVVGVTLEEVPWTPTLTGLFYWGSGDNDPTDGKLGTFTTLFPLGHAYWGQIDNFNGSNLIDISPQVTVKPTERLNVGLQYHFFQKDQASDFVWNIAGAPLGNLVTPGRNLGQELDLVATMQFNKNLQLQLGYLWYWYGSAIDNNAGIPGRNDGEQFYLQGMWSF